MVLVQSLDIHAVLIRFYNPFSPDIYSAAHLPSCGINLFLATTTILNHVYPKLSASFGLLSTRYTLSLPWYSMHSDQQSLPLWSQPNQLQRVAWDRYREEPLSHRNMKLENSNGIFVAYGKLLIKLFLVVI